ncbi:V-set and immunoglobulin domain-containing protein 1 isoform X1 [Meleagris gallopavo]|uniref:V-set and immunoglobulin domain containing 1 n=1 Tax=Meleagris gallopavo TaxID=9103 RepID=A0A803YLE5_MELGA|nr:V-set and immunoglobulin domain-containing protein 1 isoform X1 [Meleagris gallopavo]XP_010713681.1 V-set and immunoglobulin domain-containing protein 1 isoform X1 [Meleagris gallopavo]XP_010713682.1 V-set and immunoglobulin domain-containing protein 1 isoform X1 [Meleagris gallopavo]XP_010713684.1 V-set and immunoglobulin domain-containing protein 1 isoform X1 [Meleagris gallopavo]
MFPTMLKIFPILATLAGHVHGVVVTVPEKTVNVKSGGNATLLCTYTSSQPLGNFFIQWSFYSAKESQLHTPSPCHGILSMDEKSISQCQKMVYVTDARGRCSWRYKIYYYSEGQSYSYGEFKDRITASTSPGNASITISNMQPSDTGSYTCEVFSPQDDAGQSQKSVIVNVLVKPSKPFCKIEGTPEKGHLIYLLCKCDQGLPHPTYRWYKVDENTLTLVTEHFNPDTGILYIGNLTTFETGHYRCIASNIMGNSTCELDLTSMHSDGNIVAGALIGAILAAVIICAIVWVLTKKAKKKKSSSNEMQVMAQKQSNAEYAQVPSEENIPATTVLPSNVTNEQPSADEAAASETPEIDEKHEMQQEETA